VARSSAISSGAWPASGCPRLRQPDALRFALDSVRTEIPDDGEVEVVSLLGAVALGLTKALSARERGE
jgi:hypothetical protein